jgi:chromosome segregation ATPase
VNDLSAEITDQMSRIKQLEQDVKDQSESLGTKIDEFDYDSLKTRYRKTKQFLKEARHVLCEREDQIENLEQAKSAATSLANDFRERTEKAESALEDAKRNLSVERSENELLTRQLQARNRELFACERTLRGCAEQIKFKQSQMDSFVAESESLKGRVHVERAKKKAISDGLKEMAQNLTGTLIK